MQGSSHLYVFPVHQRLCQFSILVNFTISGENQVINAHRLKPPNFTEKATQGPTQSLDSGFQLWRECLGFRRALGCLLPRTDVQKGKRQAPKAQQHAFRLQKQVCVI